MTLEMKRLLAEQAYGVFYELLELEQQGRGTKRKEKELYKLLDELEIKLDDLYDFDYGRINFDELYSLAHKDFVAAGFKNERSYSWQRVYSNNDLIINFNIEDETVRFTTSLRAASIDEKTLKITLAYLQEIKEIEPNY